MIKHKGLYSISLNWSTFNLFSVILVVCSFHHKRQWKQYWIEKDLHLSFSSWILKNSAWILFILDPNNKMDMNNKNEPKWKSNRVLEVKYPFSVPGNSRPWPCFVYIWSQFLFVCLFVWYIILDIRCRRKSTEKSLWFNLIYFRKSQWMSSCMLTSPCLTIEYKPLKDVRLLLNYISIKFEISHLIFDSSAQFIYKFKE